MTRIDNPEEGEDVWYYLCHVGHQATWEDLEDDTNGYTVTL